MNISPAHLDRKITDALANAAHFMTIDRRLVEMMHKQMREQRAEIERLMAENARLRADTAAEREPN